MIALDVLIAALLGWQVFMPAVDNGKYMPSILPNGELVRMNTQDGTMVKCDKITLMCEDGIVLKEEPKKEIDYNGLDNFKRF